MSNSKFETPIEMVVTIPIDYNHETCIDTNAEKVKGQSTTYGYNDNLNSTNFANASNKLVPGKKYMVKLIPLKSEATVTTTECFDEISKHKGIFAGGQGLTVLETDKLPKGRWYVSFDNPENLWKDSVGDHGVPYLGAGSDGGLHWSLGFFERGWWRDWNGDYVLVCFCEYEEEIEIPKNSFLDTVEIVKDGSIIFT